MDANKQIKEEMENDHSPIIRKANFRFYEELNDHLPLSLQKRQFVHKFKGNPSVKDTIQAIGIPHGEVDLILVNGQSVAFDYHLQGGEEVSVFPVFESFDITSGYRLRPAPLRKIKFIVDVNLGKMVGKLRLLGFDTYFRNDLEDEEIIQIANREKRIILTRDKGILKQSIVSHGYFLRTDDPKIQVSEVINRFQLQTLIDPFTRCSACNGELNEVSKSELAGQLPEDTIQFYNDFWECMNCHKIYWKGSHFKHILPWVDSLKQKTVRSH